MKVRKVGAGLTDKIDINMTPMIDVVFQLLTFFLMTFKVVEPEGDFNIKMPLAAPSSGATVTEDFPPIRIALKAGPGGALAGITMDSSTLGTNFDTLRSAVAGFVVGNPNADKAEVEFDCDFDLRYEYVIRAVTAVTGGYKADGTPYKLIQKVKFAPPKKPAA